MSHQTISFIKSGVRVVGYVLLPLSVALGGFILIIAEILGIVEEIGCV